SFLSLSLGYCVLVEVLPILTSFIEFPSFHAAAAFFIAVILSASKVLSGRTTMAPEELGCGLEPPLYHFLYAYADVVPKVMLQTTNRNTSIDLLNPFLISNLHLIDLSTRIQQHTKLYVFPFY